MANGLTNGGSNGKGFDLDVRGSLAIMTVTGAFALAFTQLFLDSATGAEIPAWAAAIVAGVTGFYFGSRSGSDTGAIAGMQQMNVQSGLSKTVLERLDAIEAKLAPPTAPAGD